MKSEVEMLTHIDKLDVQGLRQAMRVIALDWPTYRQRAETLERKERALNFYEKLGGIDAHAWAEPARDFLHGCAHSWGELASDLF